MALKKIEDEKVLLELNGKKAYIAEMVGEFTESDMAAAEVEVPFNDITVKSFQNSMHHYLKENGIENIKCIVRDDKLYIVRK